MFVTVTQRQPKPAGGLSSSGSFTETAEWVGLEYESRFYLYLVSLKAQI